MNRDNIAIKISGGFTMLKIWTIMCAARKIETILTLRESFLKYFYAKRRQQEERVRRQREEEEGGTDIGDKDMKRQEMKERQGLGSR